ncbi:hypothetical protein NQ318_004089 [Aromia moschata]|uniref:C2H2-type domain-containing protein n=1 Tax=Aromia moschata TaxID=1265417 RepID=A0AAV8X5X5_9CUCU|nr:hypothetical protein NQ318_004089 [Aromia moschata]
MFVKDCDEHLLADANPDLNQPQEIETNDKDTDIKDIELKEENDVSPSTLINHKRSHGKMEKKIQCEICDLKFYTNWQMKFLMRRHAGKKQFMCEICSKTLKGQEYPHQAQGRDISRRRRTSPVPCVARLSRAS